jgi:serine/threonine protein kinase
MATRSEKFPDFDARQPRPEGPVKGTAGGANTEGNIVPPPATFPPDPASSCSGTQLDHYIVEAVALRTETASILRGTDVRTGREVAIKIPHIAVEGDVLFYSRFQREQEIGKKLDHPGVAKVFADEDRSRVYMAMEWVEGKSLRQILLENKKLPPERAVRIVLSLCDTLEYIHGRGIVHRDLKPENVIVDAGDGTKLIDFGIAWQAGARRLTFGKLSQIMGTPDYISPEQVRGKRGDARSDIYALGIMLYEMLAGQVPFRGSTPFITMKDRLTRDPKPLREIDPAVSVELAETVLRALARDPEHRYASVRQFAEDLRYPDKVVIGGSVGVAAKDGVSWLPQAFSYAILVLVPAIVLVLLFLARHHS